MFDLIGYISVSLVFLIIVIFALKWPAVSKILIVAFFIRLIFLIINNYLIPLPDGDMDP